MLLWKKLLFKKVLYKKIFSARQYAQLWKSLKRRFHFSLSGNYQGAEQFNENIWTSESTILMNAFTTWGTILQNGLDNQPFCRMVRTILQNGWFSTLVLTYTSGSTTALQRRGWFKSKWLILSVVQCVICILILERGESQRRKFLCAGHKMVSTEIYMSF